MNRHPVLFGATLVAVGACAIVARAVIGDPVPYAPGDDTSSARAAARTAQGYASQDMTVYEGVVGAVREVPLAGPNAEGVITFPYELVSLTSGVPEIRIQGSDRQPPPSLSVGDIVRIWTTTSTGTFVWRVDTVQSRWVPSGSIPDSIPRQYEDGFGPGKTAIYFGGVPGGLLLGVSGLVLLYRRAVRASSSRPRTVDHVAVWCGGSAILAGGIGVLLINRSPLFALQIISATLGISALGAGINGLITRRKGQLWWPSAAGVIAGLASVVFAAYLVVAFLAAFSHAGA